MPSAKKLLARVSSEVLEGQHNDAHLRRQMFRRRDPISDHHGNQQHHGAKRH